MPTPDELLDRALHGLGRSRGSDVFVLNIGAMDGESYDGTRGYVNMYGWGGLYVEPIPELFERLVASFAGRQGVAFERAAITDRDGEVEMVRIPIAATDAGDAPACFAGMAAVVPARNGMGSAADAPIVERWATTLRVPSLRLATLLERHDVQRIDVLHIDAEGWDWQILEQFDFARYHPLVVRIERACLGPEELAQAVSLLSANGYETAPFYDELIGVAAGDGAVRPAPGRRFADIALYVISYNAPEQFALWLASVEDACPELLRETDRFLLDNSIDPGTSPAYDRLAKLHGFEVIREGNLGINGGRLRCARHFDGTPGYEGMLWFEDDMLLHPPGGELCRNGFRRHVPDLLARARAIVARERLHYLKLSYTEFFGDHHFNWAWYNVPQEVREREFADGSHATRVERLAVHEGLSYAVGEHHYSNWPALMTPAGNRLLFLEDELAHPFEQTYMSLAFQRQRRGELRAGVLLASPIRHHRVTHYPAAERRE